MYIIGNSDDWKWSSSEVLKIECAARLGHRNNFTNCKNIHINIAEENFSDVCICFWKLQCLISRKNFSCKSCYFTARNVKTSHNVYLEMAPSKLQSVQSNLTYVAKIYDDHCAFACYTGFVRWREQVETENIFYSEFWIKAVVAIL